MRLCENEQRKRRDEGGPVRSRKMRIPRAKEPNRRKSTILFLIAAVLILAAVTVAGILLEGRAAVTDFTRTNLKPSLQYPFGTDWMGRDMFLRTLTGLSLSIRIGLLTALISSLIALVLGILAALGRKADAVIS